MRYRTVVADPPWDLTEINAGWKTTSNARLPYPTMSLDEIKALPVGDLAESTAHLYLWTVTSVLRHSFEVVEAWGFKPKQVLVWCKPGLGSGMRFRQNVEYVIFGTRGSGLPITRRDVGTWHEWPRGQAQREAGRLVRPHRGCQPRSLPRNVRPPSSPRLGRVGQRGRQRHHARRGRLMARCPKRHICRPSSPLSQMGRDGFYWCVGCGVHYPPNRVLRSV